MRNSGRIACSGFLPAAAPAIFSITPGPPWRTSSGGARQTDDMTALHLRRMAAAAKGETAIKDGPITTELRLPSRLGFEKVAMSTAATVAELMGFSQDRIEDLKTAVAESCINAIEHGNHLDEELSVVVTLTMDSKALEVCVRDHGPRRAPGGARARYRPQDARRGERAGNGMFLIQALVDEVEYVSEQAGSYARLVIRLKAEGAQGA